MRNPWLVDQVEYLWMRLHRSEIPIEKHMLVREHLRGVAMQCPEEYLREWIKELKEELNQ